MTETATVESAKKFFKEFPTRLEFDNWRRREERKLYSSKYKLCWKRISRNGWRPVMFLVWKKEKGEGEK